MMWIIYSIFAVYLILCSWQDIKTMEVPLYFHLPAITLLLAWHVSSGSKLLDYILPAVAIFVFLALAVRFVGLGGADAITGGLICFCMGAAGIYAIFFAFLFCIPVQGYRKWKQAERPYPFLPYLAVGYGIAILLSWYRGML